jgi:hypothetical protein
MANFFDGWRRKIGCIALLMACGMTTVWLRSMTWEDDISLRISDRDVILIQTYDMGIGVWWVWESQSLTLDDVVFMRGRFTWTSNRVSELGHSSHGLYELKKRRWLGFSFLRETEEAIKFQVVLVPYVFPVVLLTGLSVSLILGKPRKRARSTRL